MVATESALRGRACKPLADGSVLFCGGGAQALQVFAVAFMRLHDSGALRDERKGLNNAKDARHATPLRDGRDFCIIDAFF